MGCKIIYGPSESQKKRLQTPSVVSVPHDPRTKRSQETPEELSESPESDPNPAPEPSSSESDSKG